MNQPAPAVNIDAGEVIARLQQRIGELTGQAVMLQLTNEQLTADLATARTTKEA